MPPQPTSIFADAVSTRADKGNTIQDWLSFSHQNLLDQKELKYPFEGIIPSEINQTEM